MSCDVVGRWEVTPHLLILTLIHLSVCHAQTLHSGGETRNGSLSNLARDRWIGRISLKEKKKENKGVNMLVTKTRARSTTTGKKVQAFSHLWRQKPSTNFLFVIKDRLEKRHIVWTSKPTEEMKMAHQPMLSYLDMIIIYRSKVWTFRTNPEIS